MESPPAIDLPRGNLLLIGTGALPVSLLPGWVMCLRHWYPWSVRVGLTWSAARLVAPAAIASVTGHPVIGPDWDTTSGRVDHREAAGWADLVLVVPATGNFVAKCAAGITDSLALATVSFTSAPVVLAPSLAGPVAAGSAAAARNLRQLVEDGFHVMPTAVGLSAHSGQSEVGAMPTIFDVLRFVAAALRDRREAGAAPGEPAAAGRR